MVGTHGIQAARLCYVRWPVIIPKDIHVLYIAITEGNTDHYTEDHYITLHYINVISNATYT